MKNENVIKFTREVKQKWLAALRGGEYTQAPGALYAPIQEGYCCLGVLAKLSGELDSLGRCTMEGWSGNSYLTARHSGVYHEAPTLVRGLATSVQLELARMNDSGSSFTEIADWIEANVPAVDEVASIGAPEVRIEANIPAIDEPTNNER